MSLVEIVENARRTPLVDEDGETVTFDLLPPLSDAEIDEFAKTLPCPLPDGVRELLSYCRGFEGSVADVVDFTGQSFLFEHEAIFPHGVPTASDGFGNFWVVDLTAQSTDFGPVYFACHDAPIILYQSASLRDFLTELFRAGTPPHQSLVDDVHEDRLFRVWRKNPGVISHSDCMRSSDSELAAFAGSLDSSWSVVDLRGATPGMGFSWGRYGPRTRLKRHGSLAIFAYSRPEGILKRLLGKK